MPRLLICLLLLIAPSIAHAEWRVAQSKHFEIYSEDSEGELRREAERLEAVHYLMLLAYGVKDEENPYRVRIYFVDDMQDVADLTDNRPNIAGFYKVSMGEPVAVVPRHTGTHNRFDSDLVLFHEYAHHFMLEYFPMAYPTWLSEGWAELVSTASFEREGRITYGKAAEHRAYDLQHTGWIPIETLMRIPLSDVPQDARSAYYGESWLLTHYLIFSDERSKQLREFIARINRGESFADAAKVFGSLDELDHEVHQYLREANFYYKAPKLPESAIGPITVHPVSPGRAAMMEDEIGFIRSMDHKEATAFMAKVRADAARFPNDPDVLQFLAEVEYDTDAYDAANATVDRLLAIAPNRVRARYYKGMIGLALADKMKGDAREAAIKAARAQIVTANRENPEDPLPLEGYFRSFIVEGVAPPDLAMAGMIKAMHTVPQDPGVRLSLASLMIARGNKADARAVLAPVAYNPHGGEAQKAARKMLAAIDEASDRQAAAAGKGGNHTD